MYYITDNCANEKTNTKYITTTPLSKEECLKTKPELQNKEVYTLDCIGLSLEAFGKSIPNAPMLGAFLKISQILDLDFFLESFKKVLGKKLPQKIIDANMEVIKKAYNEVK